MNHLKIIAQGGQFKIVMDLDTHLLNEAAADRLEHAREHPWYHDDCEFCIWLQTCTDEEIVEKYKRAKARLGELTVMP